MSEFDKIADSMWTEIESVFADDAIWSPEGLPDRAIRADISTTYVVDALGAQHNVIVMQFSIYEDNDRPGPRDHFRVLTGPFVGEYQMYSILEDDGITLSITIRRV